LSGEKYLTSARFRANRGYYNGYLANQKVVSSLCHEESFERLCEVRIVLLVRASLSKLFQKFDFHLISLTSPTILKLEKSLSLYIKMGVQMFVCLLVCGGLMEIQTPAPILMKFCTHIPTCPRKVLVQV